MKGIKKIFFGLLLMTIIGISCQVQAKAGVDSVSYSTTDGLSGSFSLGTSDDDPLIVDTTGATIYANYGGTAGDVEICSLTYSDASKEWTVDSTESGFTVSPASGTSFSIATVSGSVVAQKNDIRAAIKENAAGDNRGATSVKVIIDSDVAVVEDDASTEVKGVRPTGDFSDASTVGKDILEEKITFVLTITESGLDTSDYLLAGEHYKLKAESADGWLSGAKVKFNWYNGSDGDVVSPEYEVNAEVEGNYAPFTYKYDAVTDIELDSSIDVIEKGVTESRDVTVTSASFGWSSSDITWTSAPATGISVTKVAGGIEVRGTAAETYTLTATINDGEYPGEAYTQDFVVEVTDSTPPEPTAISLSLAPTTISKDGYADITVEATAPTGAKVDISKLTFTNSDGTVASITDKTQSGLKATAKVKGDKAGTTTITASYEGGLYSNPVTLTVEDSSTVTLEFDQSAYTVQVGKTVTATVTATPSIPDLATKFDDGTYYYKTSGNSAGYATFTGSKTPAISINGKKEGSFTLVVKEKKGDKESSSDPTLALCSVTVTSGIKIELSSNSVAEGESVSATISSTKGETLDPNKLAVTATSPSVVSIGTFRQSGADIKVTITGESAGTTKIKAVYDNDASAESGTLTVTGASGDITGLTSVPDVVYVGSNKMKKTILIKPIPSTYNLQFSELGYTFTGKDTYAVFYSKPSDVGYTVQGIAEGDASVTTYLLDDKNIKTTTKVHVVDQADFKLEWDLPSSIAKSSTKTVTVEADDGTDLDVDDLEITSSNPSVASVTKSSSDTTFVLKGISSGTTTITASYADENGYATLTKTVTVTGGGSGDDGDFEIEYFPDSRTLNVKMPKSLTKPDGTVVDNITGFYVRFRYNGTELANTGTKYAEIFRNTSSTSTATVDAKYFEDLTNNKSNQSLFTGDSPKIEYAVYPVANSTIISSIELSDTTPLYKITLGSTNSTYFTYKVSLEGTDVEKSSFYGLKNQTFKVTATPKDGYSFSRWSDSNYTSNPIDSYKVTTSTTLYAVATTSTSSSVSSSSMNASNSTSSKYGNAAGGGAGGSGNYDDVPRTGESKTDIWVLWSVLLLSILTAGFMIYRRFGLVKAISRIEDQELAEAEAAAEKEREENLKKVTDLRNIK